jgi:hypothetical protein
MEIWLKLRAEHYLLRISRGEVSEKLRMTSEFFPNGDNDAYLNAFRWLPRSKVRTLFWRVTFIVGQSRTKIRSRKSLITELA